MKAMRIGTDLDNTIIDYSEILAEAVRKYSWIGVGAAETKQQIRDSIRCLPDGETKWMKLQALAYGELIHRARVIEGVTQFIKACRNNNIAVLIISQKTQYAELDMNGKDLREEALTWLHTHGFFNPKESGLDRANVFFENTITEKVRRIAKVNCTHFIDDLEEVLNHPEFPDGVARILFTHGAVPSPGFRYPSFSTWKDIEGAIFSHAY